MDFVLFNIVLPYDERRECCDDDERTTTFFLCLLQKQHKLLFLDLLGQAAMAVYN